MARFGEFAINIADRSTPARRCRSCGELKSIIQKNSVKSIMAENAILQELDFSLLVTIRHAFQDRDNLYVIMRNLNGGDMRFHLIQRRVFSEAETMFIVACIVASLEYVHKKNIIHRDLKPENLVFDDTGYLYLTDFGIAKYWRAQNAENTSGTPGYMSPEVLCHKNHSYSVDYYALGVIVYECISGRRPHVGKSRKEIKDQVMAKQAVLKESMAVGSWSSKALDFCNQLIQRKRERRLGENGISELKSHPWLSKINWEDIVAKKVDPPFKPNLYDVTYDQRNFLKEDEKFSDKELENLKKQNIPDLFKGYDYDSTRTILFEKSKESNKSNERIIEELNLIKSTATS